MRTVKAVLAGILLVGVIHAQQAPPAGHYEGTMKAPNREVSLGLDIDKHEKLGWIGSVDINAPNAPKGLLLDSVTVDGDNVSWNIGAFGGAKFSAKHNAEQKTLSGTVATPGGDIPFEFKRTGDAKVNLPAPSTAITADFEGKWEGTIETPGGALRLAMTFTNLPTGKGAGEIVSIDQGNAKIPITTIAQEGTKLKFEARSVGGSFTGAMNEAKTEIPGEWTQGGQPLPLVLKKQKPETK